MRIFKNNSGILVSEIRETIGENMESIWREYGENIMAC